jgi:hypothetical protein
MAAAWIVPRPLGDVVGHVTLTCCRTLRRIVGGQWAASVSLGAFGSLLAPTFSRFTAGLPNLAKLADGATGL